MKRKISMFAVTLCLTAAMLTGCGGNKNGTTTSPAPAASTDNATETPKNTPEASAEAEGTSKPSATEKASDDGDNAGNAVNDIVDGVGDGVKDTVDGVEDAVDDVTKQGKINLCKKIPSKEICVSTAFPWMGFLLSVNFRNQTIGILHSLEWKSAVGFVISLPLGKFCPSVFDLGIDIVRCEENAKAIM